MRSLSFLFATTLLTFLLIATLCPLSADAQYGIAVTPGKPTYSPGERVIIAVVVPQISNATIQVNNPSGETLFIETTMAQGAATVEFKLEDDAEEGEYEIYASAVSDDGQNHASTTGSFQVSTEGPDDDEVGYIPGFITPTVIASLGFAGALVTFFRRH